MALLQDVRFAFRTLRKTPGVTLIAVLSLGLAIAGNTTVYSLISAFLSRPLPYENVERLELIGENSGNELLAGQLTTIAPANYLDVAERQTSFSATAAYRNQVKSLDNDGDEAEQLTVGAVTPGFFPLLGAVPTIGRTFADEEGVSGNERVVMLGHAFWTERFGGRADIAGEILDMGGEQFEVVGVVAERFEWLLAPNTDVWIPLVLEPGRASRQQRTLFAVGRLRDGVDTLAAQAEMDTLMQQLAREHPKANRGYTFQLLNMRHDLPDARNKMFFRLLQVALIFVLLIACANIANLLLSRSQAREREIAVRTSLGAGRARIVRQLFTESILMASIAGVLGVALGYVGMRLVNQALGSVLPSFWIPTLDVRVLLYSLGVTMLGGILFGLAPVLQTARFDLLPSLKDGTQGASAGARRKLASNTLVVLEIGFALAFLAGASIMIKTFESMQTSEAGFDTENVLVMRVDLPEKRYRSDEQRADVARIVSERIASIGGVTGVALSSQTPRGPFIPEQTFEIDGRVTPEDEAPPRVAWMDVSAGYFETMGIAIRSGREISAADGPGTAKVAVVNQSMADRQWPETSPIGRSITILGARWEIVGVVEDVRHELLVRKDRTPMVYVPWAQQPTGAVGLAIKTVDDPASVAPAVRETLRAVDPTVAVTQVQSLDEFVAQFWVGQRVFTAILSAFGILALLLAALGTYGVLSYSVAQRRHEIGIRMAIGAGRRTVMGMIVRRGVLLALVGLAVGLPLVVLEARVIASIFAGLAPVRPTAMIGTALLLVAITALASALPARKAASIDPMRALRSD